MNLYGNKAVEMCQGVRKATDRSFAPCSGQDERRPGLLFEADGVLLTNEGNKAEGGRTSSFCSSHQTSLLGDCSLSHATQFICITLEVKWAGKITPSTE